jgi:hypothetical protein
MLQKNIDKNARKARPTWNGYYSRKTPTKKERLTRAEKKHKGRGCDNDSSASFYR